MNIKEMPQYFGIYYVDIDGEESEQPYASCSRPELLITLLLDMGVEEATFDLHRASQELTAGTVDTLELGRYRIHECEPIWKTEKTEEEEAEELVEDNAVNRSWARLATDGGRHFEL